MLKHRKNKGNTRQPCKSSKALFFGGFFSLRSASILFATVFGLALLVEICVHLFRVPAYLLPPPSVIVRTLILAFPNIGPHLWTTVIEAISGFALATVFAILGAVFISHLRSFESILIPVAVAVQTIPIIIITPLLIVVMGNGIAPKIVIAALISFFPTFVNMTRGLKAVDTTALNLFYVLNASKLQILFKLRFPSAMPYLFSSLKIAAANCFIGAIVGEWVSADHGIGFLAQIYLHQLKIDYLYATVLASSLVAIIFVFVTSVIENAVCFWHESGNEPGN